MSRTCKRRALDRAVLVLSWIGQILKHLVSQWMSFSAQTACTTPILQPFWPDVVVSLSRVKELWFCLNLRRRGRLVVEKLSLPRPLLLGRLALRSSHHLLDT